MTGRSIVVLDATHDHNTPTGGHPVNTSSPDFAVPRKGVVEAARQAHARLQPARIGFGRGETYGNTDRDAKIGEDYHMGHAPGGPFTEIAEHLKAASPFDRTMMVTLLPKGASDIPTDRACTLPSLMAVANSVKPGCAEPAVIGAFRRMMVEDLPAWKAAR